MTLFGVSEFTFLLFQNQWADFDNYCLHHFNAKSILCTILQKSQNRRKYSCDSFREVGSQILVVLHPVKGEWSYQGETKCVPTTSTNSEPLLNPHSTVKDGGEIWGK